MCGELRMAWPTISLCMSSLFIYFSGEIGLQGAYYRNEEDTSLTQRMILEIHKRGGVSETSPENIEVIKKRKNDNFMAPFLSHATHIITQIEYGSNVYIELVHEGKAILKD